MSRSRPGNSAVRVTLAAVLLGAATAGGLTLAGRLVPAHRSAAGPDFQPVVLLETTPPPTTTAMPTTTTVTTTRPTTTTQSAPSQTAQVFALVNRNRADAGCAPLTEDPRLDTAAQRHSVDMSDNHYFSHTTPSGVTFDQRERAAGYPKPGGENIAQGQTSAQQVMTAWLNSPDHRANILNCQFRAIGIGLDTNGSYWTQDFGY